MFAPLYELVSKGKKKDIEITILTELKKMKFKVFSSYIEKPNVNSIIPKLNMDEYTKFIERAKKKSSIAYGVDASPENKMITLSTCDNTGRKRAIVHAISTYDSLVPDMDIPESDTVIPTVEE